MRFACTPQRRPNAVLRRQKVQAKATGNRPHRDGCRAQQLRCLIYGQIQPAQRTAVRKLSCSPTPGTFQNSGICSASKGRRRRLDLKAKQVRGLGRQGGYDLKRSTNAAHELGYRAVLWEVSLAGPRALLHIALPCLASARRCSLSPECRLRCSRSPAVRRPPKGGRGRLRCW